MFADNVSLEWFPPDISLAEIEINDEDGGNGNHEVNPGEEIKLVVNLENSGKGDAKNVKGELNIEDSYVTVSQGEASFGDIPEGKEKSNTSNPFILQLSPSISDGHEVKCVLKVSSNREIYSVELPLDLKVIRGIAERSFPTSASLKVQPYISDVGLRISYTLASTSGVDLSVYSPTGELVRSLDSGMRREGHYSLLWNGRDGAGKRVSGGIYFIKFQAGNQRVIKKIVLIGG